VAGEDDPELNRRQRARKKRGRHETTLTVVLRASHPRKVGKPTHQDFAKVRTRTVIEHLAQRTCHARPTRLFPIPNVPNPLRHHSIAEQINGTHTHLSHRKFDTGTAPRPICACVTCQQQQQGSVQLRVHRTMRSTHVKYTQFGGPVAPPFSVRYLGS